MTISNKEKPLRREYSMTRVVNMQIVDKGKDFSIMVDRTLEFEHHTCANVKKNTKFLLAIISKSFENLTEKILLHLFIALVRCSF